MHITLLFHAAIVTFMIFFSSVVAPAVFKTLSQKAVGAFLRVLFPRMFIFGLGLSLCASLAASFVVFGADASPENAKNALWLSLLSAVGFAVNAFVVTPIINRNRDGMLAEDPVAITRFKQFHFLSVGIFMVQLGASLYLLIVNLG